MATIRAFVAADVSTVADLIWKVLHEQQGPSPASVKSYLEELFLRNPWVEQDLVSLVCEDSAGKIVGFFGVVPRRMSFQGKSLRLAFGSNFVLDPESRASMAAMQLVRTFMKGPQDVSITDSATDGAMQLLRGMGFAVVPLYSLLWARPLRPAKYALQGVARLKKSKAVAMFGAIASPFCGLADYAATKIKVSPFRQTAQKLVAEELDLDGLLARLASVANKHWLLPEYNRDSLEWVVRFMENRNAFGDLRKLQLRDAGGKIVGWYVYGLRPGAIGDVLQVGSEANSIGAVLDHLFFDAWEHGLIGLHGRMEPQFMDELTKRSSFFLRNGSWTLVNSSKPELVALLQSGNAFFSRLEGEWALRYGSGLA